MFELTKVIGIMLGVSVILSLSYYNYYNHDNDNCDDEDDMPVIINNE
jgi:hypothetical protein